MIIGDRTSSGYDRLTCTICGGALVHQPHMGGLRWIHEESVFRKTHYKKCERKLPTPEPKQAVATQAASAEVGEKAGELAILGPEGNSRA